MTTIRRFAKKDTPLLSLDDYRGARKSEFLEGLLRSIRDFGFIVLSKHDVDPEGLERSYQLSRQFFAQPEDAKSPLRYDLTDQKKFSNVGYFPFKAETAVGSKEADFKEFFHVGNQTTSDRMRDLYASNVWPDVAGFRESFTTLYKQFETCGDTLLLALSEAYGVDLSYARQLVDDGNHVLRTIHYPPVPETEKAMWAAQHTGIQLLGLQPRASHPGLQFHTKSGEWIAPSDEFSDTIIVNVGEMLAHLLGNRVQATLHRVMNETPEAAEIIEDRYAIVFFYHANPLEVLRPVTDKPEDFPEVQVGSWLSQRFKDLGLFAD